MTRSMKCPKCRRAQYAVCSNRSCQCWKGIPTGKRAQRWTKDGNRIKCPYCAFVASADYWFDREGDEMTDQQRAALIVARFVDISNFKGALEMGVTPTWLLEQEIRIALTLARSEGREEGMKEKDALSRRGHPVQVRRATRRSQQRGDSMSEHTPGPWEIIQSWDEGRHRVGGFPHEIAHPRKSVEIALVGQFHNACLISAAPDLLEALKALTDACLIADLIGELPGEVDGTLIDAALAAISKAIDVATSGEPPVSAQPGKPSRNVSMNDQPSPETKGSAR